MSDYPICRIPECTGKTTTSHFSNGAGLCDKHEKFYSTIPALRSDVLDRCGCSNSRFILGNIGSSGCQFCSTKDAPPITDSILDELVHFASLLAKDLNFYSMDVMKEYKILCCRLQKTPKEAMEAIRERYSALEPGNEGKKVKKGKGRVSKEGLKTELSDAALSVAVTQITKNVQKQLPKLVGSLGLSPERAESVNHFLNSNVGSLILLVGLSSLSTYLPVPDKYEAKLAAVAEKFRIETMKVLGTEVIGQVTELLKPIFLGAAALGVEDIQEKSHIVIEAPVEVLG